MPIGNDILGCAPATITPNQARGLLVPTRPFGHTGIQISKLCLGGSSVVGQGCQSLLEEAIGLGILCWEANPFIGRAFGDFFRTHEGLRERVFLSAKSRNAALATMQDDLERALVDNETSVIDFFAIHGIEDVAVLTNDVRRWAEKAKADGKIRFFGFCTHQRMDRCLDAAADLGWIDGIQVFYNYRMQALGTMQAALQKCHEKGIGLITVKSMGLCVKREDELTLPLLLKDQLAAALANQALSFEQAKLRAIWRDPYVSSICSLMPSQAILRANAAAAIDDEPLDGKLMRALSDYVDATSRYFCRRCCACRSAAPAGFPVFNVMETLMYARAYGSRDLAAMLYARIPAAMRGKLTSSDYSTVETACPQGIAIAQLMREAHREFEGG